MYITWGSTFDLIVMTDETFKSNQDYIEIRMKEYTGTTYDPYVQMTYTAGPVPEYPYGPFLILLITFFTYLLVRHLRFFRSPLGLIVGIHDQ